MKLIRILTILFLLAIPAGMFGCGGGGAKVQQQNITLGKELQDLDEAYKKGLLDEKEYKKVRKELIEKYTD
jgi:hypothetical protein